MIDIIYFVGVKRKATEEAMQVSKKARENWNVAIAN